MAETRTPRLDERKSDAANGSSGPGTGDKGRNAATAMPRLESLAI